MIGEKEDESIINEIKSDIDNIESQVVNENLQDEKVNKFEKTFYKLKNYSLNLLNYSHTDANREIDRLLDMKETEISPLLRYYNDIL